jgi:hypothetical protein
MLSKLSRCAAAATCLLLLAIPAAYADAADPIAATINAAASSATTVDLNPLWDSVMPYIVVVLSGIATAIIGFLAKKANDVFHVTLEQKYRDSLHSAAVTGINLAVSKLGNMVTSMHPDAKNAVTAMAINWVISSVPDALKFLGVSQSSLESLVASKAEAMLGLSTATAAAASGAAAQPVDEPVAAAAPAAPAAPAAVQPATAG